MSSESGRASADHLTTQRLEAFSDGVFSIAITLLVLELSIPESRSATPPPLGSALLHLWPSYIGYVLSFITVGIYWANHHSIFRFYQRTDHAFNLLNLAFLMSISFLPFPTAVLSRYVMVPGQGETAVMFYAFGLVLPAACFLAMWTYASRRHQLIDRRLPQDFIRYLSRQYMASVLIYTTALIVARYAFRVGLGICIGLTLLYLLPSKKPKLV
jgi:uncharacterized membrane protein